MNTNSDGNVMVTVLITTTVVAALVGISLSMSEVTNKVADRSRDFAAAQAAAEGAIEYAYGVWKQKVTQQNGVITNAQANANLSPPAFPGIAYTSGQGLRIYATDQDGATSISAFFTPAPVATPAPVTVDLAGYPGWRGRSFAYVAAAKVEPSPAISVPYRYGIKRNFIYAEVPLFQAMFFFQDRLEIYRPAGMIVDGLVHTNDTLYISSYDDTPLTFSGKVSYVNGYDSEDAPPGADQWSGYAGNPGSGHDPIFTTGKDAQTSQVDAIAPLGKDTSTVINTTDSNPNNDSLHELIEPPNSSFSDPPEIARRRLYNKAGIIVAISGSSVSISTQNGTSLSGSQRFDIQNALSQTTIYDRREGKNVGVSDLDISKVNSALNSASGFNNVLYVYDTSSTAAAPKAVRLINGGVLPDAGLTVASMNPVYIKGDYNTGTTNDPTLVPANVGNADDKSNATVSGYTRKPSGVIGDAVMLLSNAWQDSNSSGDLGTRDASNTTYNTAIMSGFIPSEYQPSSGAAYGYSGGANNFPRFLENWGGNYCTYYGSMVELFESKTFTGAWDTGSIYRPPLRRWNFDTNYTNNPPPGSVDAVVYNRGSWSRY